MFANLVSNTGDNSDNPFENKKDLMSNLKKLESMMNAYSKPKETSDEERIKDIAELKRHEAELLKVSKAIPTTKTN
jgi:hypothetical protein